MATHQGTPDAGNQPRTVGDGLASKIITRRKLRDELRDMGRAYRQRIRDLDREIEESAAESDQSLLDLR